MARQTKKIDADSLIGQIALMRSSIWQNGNRKVAAIITEATTDEALLPARAVALVSVTAFAPGTPSRIVRDVPLYDGPQEDDVLPSAWLKR